MNEKVKNIKKILLSNNWYTLNKIIFDYRMENGEWVEQAREAYDRGNGATVLLYNRSKQTVILVSQFRMPTYLNGNPTGMLIETCAGLLDGDDPETCVIKEAEEESGFRVSHVEKVFEAADRIDLFDVRRDRFERKHEPDLGDVEREPKDECRG